MSFSAGWAPGSSVIPSSWESRCTGCLPDRAGHDFQDLPEWRSAVLATLAQAEAACKGPLIVPMTIVHDDHFDEIIGGLRTSGVDVRH